MQCNAKELKKAITATARATARDDSRPSLTSVLFEFTPGQLRLTGADGFRMTRVTIPCETDQTISVIVNAKELKKYKAGKGNVELSLDNNVMYLDSHKAAVIDAKYPDCEFMFTIQPRVMALLDAGELKTALKIAKPYAKETANITLLRVRPDRIIVQAHAEELGYYVGQVNAVTDAEEEVIVAVNYKYLLDALTGEKGEVMLAFDSGTRPIQVVGKTHSVIMPMHLHDRYSRNGQDKYNEKLAEYNAELASVA